MSARQTSPNPYRTAAQAAKAGRIARTLAGFNATGEDARALPGVGRRMTEELAGVGVSSDDTWALVPELLTALASVPVAEAGSSPHATCPTCRKPVHWVNGNLVHGDDGTIAVTADGATVCEMTFVPTCPACGRAVYRIDRRYSLGSLRSPGPLFGSIDPTLRHSVDGTVAVERDGAVVCDLARQDREVAG